MKSVRESLVTEVLSRLTTAVTPVAVIRQPTVALPRAQMPALVVSVVSDNPVTRINSRVERTLVLLITALARDSSDGYAVADDLICKAHTALLADPSLGGLALAITEGEADSQIEDADIDAVAIPVAYHLSYRTLVADITQKG